MNLSYVLLLAFLIGVIGGLRTMTAPAVVAWAANRHWLNLLSSPLAFMGSTAAVAVFTALALGELPATNLVTPPGLTPLSVVIWGLLHTGVESHLAGVVLVMLAAVTAAGLLAAWALSRLGHDRSDQIG